VALAAGLLLAVASAVALSWGFFVQHGVASGLETLSVRRPVRSLWLLFSNLRWLSGYLVGWLGWGLYVAALHFVALSVVQAIAAGGIGVLALLVRRAARLSRRELAASAVSVVGLALLGASLVGNVPRSQHVGWAPVAVAVGASLAAALLGVLVSWRTGALAFALGAASGLCYAAGDIATKGALGGSGLVFVPILLACHASGFVALQLAFQRGGAISTAGASTLLTNSVPIAAGVALFGERVPAGALGVARVASFALVVAAAVLLARADGR